MPKNKQHKPVNIALQGGGAHGAFAWGVLDKILEDGRLDIEGFTATSAGTMNALCVAQGMMENGNQGARDTLEAFWRAVSEEGFFYSPVKGLPYERFFGMGNGENPFGYFWFDTLTRMFSPYQFNPYDVNPLRALMERFFDFEKIKGCDCMKLFISATNVKTGRIKVFHTQEMSAAVAEASACLPFLFQAVEVEGEFYWDGGYMGNPAIYPLFYETEALDIILINLNPIERDEVPTTSQDIMNRMNEITFNSNLMGELRAIDFVNRLFDEDLVNDKFKKRYKNIRLHSVRADEMMREYSVASKFDTDWYLLTELRDKGREHAEKWLHHNIANIGDHASSNVKQEFLK